MITRRRHSMLLLTSIALATAGCRGGADSTTAFPGTVELDESDAAPLVGGRVIAVRVQEGDSVRIGDTLAVLTQSAIPATLEDRRARLAAARARLEDLRRGSRSAELDRAQADLQAAETEAERAARDLARAEQLVKGGVIPQQDYEHARTLAETTARRRDAARATLDLALEGTRSDQIRAAEAEVQSATALVAGARADVGELAVLAAVDGVVLGRHVQPGEVVAAGTPLVTVGAVAHRWVRVYLPASLVATLPAGAPAEVSVAESRSGRAAESPIHGRLGSVGSRAEFTPRAALTEEERADLLFASRIELIDPPATLRPGLPVTVRFGGAAP